MDMTRDFDHDVEVVTFGTLVHDSVRTRLCNTRPHLKACEFADDPFDLAARDQLALRADAGENAHTTTSSGTSAARFVPGYKASSTVDLVANASFSE